MIHNMTVTDNDRESLLRHIASMNIDNRKYDLIPDCRGPIFTGASKRSGSSTRARRGGGAMDVDHVPGSLEKVRIGAHPTVPIVHRYSCWVGGT
jgi:hypothetical protein